MNSLDSSSSFKVSSSTYSADKAEGDGNVLDQFVKGDGKLNNKESSNEMKQSVGISVPFKIPGKSSASIRFFRTFRV